MAKHVLRFVKSFWPRRRRALSGCIDWARHPRRVRQSFFERCRTDRRAEKMHHRFNDVFWDEESGFYAFALDGTKKPVLSVASNPGHCLWSGIVPPERAARVIARLMRDDMWSGWGIRTLSADHPAYNPFSYQNGAVWPHDNGLIAQGFKRYGHADEAARIAHDVAAAGCFFMLNRMPELYAGLGRSANSFPLQYLGANVPQAWAAGSILSLLHAMLGLQPDAPHGKLYIDPTLPDWLNDLTVKNLRFGGQIFDIRFWRSNAETKFDVLKGDQDYVMRRRIVAWNNSVERGEGNGINQVTVVGC